MNRHSRCSGINPPIPASSSSSQDPSKSIGQRLLTLLRSLEKNTDERETGALEEAIDCLQCLISRTSRHGLLQGDVEMAEKVLAASSSSSTKQNVGEAGTKRGRTKATKSNELGIHQDDGVDSQHAGPAAALDVDLIMSGILRILGGPKSGDDAIRELEQDDRLLALLAADLCTAICGYNKAQSKLDTCAIAEYELIATSGKQILAGLESTAQVLLTDVGKTNGMYELTSDHNEHVHALIATLRASAALVGLFAAKLARSTAILSGLQELGWEAMKLTDERATRAAAILLATLPAAGGKDGVAPSEIWNQSLVDSVGCLGVLVKAVAPVNRKLTADFGSWESSLSDRARRNVNTWIQSLRETASEAGRADNFLQLVNGLVCLYTSILGSESCGKAGRFQAIDSEIEIELLLDLSETLLSFPVASEAIYYGTKKRLRLESVDDGLLSPTTLATEIANNLKLRGHELLDETISAVGGPALLPHARRIVRMSNAALLTSSSAALRNVLDPTSAVQLDGKRRRWLHTSLVLRAASIKTFQEVILAVGIDPRATSFFGSPSDSNDTDGSIMLVAGCLVEQLFQTSARENRTEDWGSLLERGQLVMAAADCLDACLKSGGEYLPVSVRELVDSVASSCLSSLMSSKTTDILSSAMVKRAFLSFGTSCLCIPWPDGACSSIADELRKAADRWSYDCEAVVRLAATTALTMCDTVANPRVPAFQVVSRTHSSNGSHSNFSSASVLADNLDRAEKEFARVEALDSGTSHIKQNRLENAKKRAKTESNTSSLSKPDTPQQGNESSVPSSENKSLQVEVKKHSDLAPSASTKNGKSETLQNSTEPEERMETDSCRKPPVADDDEDFPLIVDCAPDAGDE